MLVSWRGIYYVLEENGYRYTKVGDSGRGYCWRLWISRSYPLQTEWIRSCDVDGKMVIVNRREVPDNGLISGVRKESEVMIIKFPAYGDIVVTQKGTKILIPSDEKVVYDVFVKCGYRGTSDFKVMRGICSVYKYDWYESPRGNLGISAGALIVATPEEEVVIEYHRTGRLYGSPSKGLLILKNGEIKEVGDITYDDYVELGTV